MPSRSPLEVLSLIRKYALGQAFAEVGTRYGDIVSRATSFAKSTFAFEMKPEYCNCLSVRGVDHFCGNFLEANRASFNSRKVNPFDSTVYYWWPGDHAVSQLFMEHIMHQSKVAAVCLLGYDPWNERDMFYLKGHVSAFRLIEKHTTFYFDGEGKRQYGAFIVIVYNCSASMLVA